MTENEAIEELQRIRPYVEIVPQRAEALDMAIKALEEIQQYREIGTVEEFRKLVREQKDVKEEMNSYIRSGLCETIMHQMPYYCSSTPKASKKQIIKYLKEHEIESEFIDDHVNEAFCCGFEICKKCVYEDLEKIFKIVW